MLGVLVSGKSIDGFSVFVGSSICKHTLSGAYVSAGTDSSSSGETSLVTSSCQYRSWWRWRIQLLWRVLILHITFPTECCTVLATHKTLPNKRTQIAVPSVNFPERIFPFSGVLFTASWIRSKRVFVEDVPIFKRLLLLLTELFGSWGELR